jgi:hypothetical protein
MVMQAEQPTDRAPVGARALICAQCGRDLEAQSRPDKKFCSGACRARHSRDTRARELAETIAKLTRLAGLRR